MSDLVLALDVGGTHVSAGLVERATATVSARSRVALPEGASRDELLGLLAEAAASSRGAASRVAVAAPGPFDYERGISWIEHKLEALRCVDLRNELAGALGMSPDAIAFVNDAEAFVLGEWWAGAAAGHTRVVGVTLGTGLGSAFLEDGRPLRSDRRVPPQGALYLVSYRGAPVEDTISRAALIGRYGDATLDVADIAARARAGDAAARDAFAAFAGALGEVLDPWLRSFEATCLVVGGAIARTFDLLEEGLRGLAPLVVVTSARNLEDAPLLGAAIALASEPRSSTCGSTSTASQVASLRRERIAAGARPLHELSVAEARANQRKQPPASATSDAVDVLELAGPVPIRVYRPASSGPVPVCPVPVCVWLTGGGWVLDTHLASEQLCRRLAAETPCAVATVRYRLAPEHPFPAALEDCAAAVHWLAAQAEAHGLDASRLALGGTSAGANLAAALALELRDTEGPRPALQILAYPPLLHGAETDSMRSGGDWVFLDRKGVDWCWSHYLAAAEDGADPRASPLRAPHLRDLPRALVLTAGLDPLHDDGALYASRLRASGVLTDEISFEGVPHGFLSLTERLDAASDARAAVVAALQEAFG